MLTYFRIDTGVRRSLQRAAMVVAVLAGATAANAAPITFAYEGEVLFVGALDPANPFPVEPTFGTPLGGTFTFDSTALDGIPLDPTTGSYASSGAPFQLTLSLGGLTFTYDAVSIGVTEGYSSAGPGDEYLVGYAAGPTVLSLRFIDLAGLMFSSDALPLTPPDLSALFTELFFTDIVDGNLVDLGGTLTSFRCTDGCAAVPEPTGLLLFAAGLSAFVARRARRIVGHE